MKSNILKHKLRDRFLHRFDVEKDYKSYLIFDKHKQEYVDFGDGILLLKEEVDEFMGTKNYKILEYKNRFQKGESNGQ